MPTTETLPLPKSIRAGLTTAEAMALRNCLRHCADAPEATFPPYPETIDRALAIGLLAELDPAATHPYHRYGLTNAGRAALAGLTVPEAEALRWVAGCKAHGPTDEALAGLLELGLATMGALRPVPTELGSELLTRLRGWA